MPLKLRASFLAVSAVAIGLGSINAYAIDGTWNGTTSAEWTTGTNWSSTPSAPDDVATFTTNAPTSITISNAASINMIQFNAGASSYSFTNTVTFDINGIGIVNNSLSTQSFLNAGTINFNNSSTAGNATIANMANSANINFSGSSTAGNAGITNNFSVLFRDSSTAGNASIVNNNFLTFNNSTSAGNAGITNNEGLSFFGSSTASSANIVNNRGIGFDGSSTAGTANITNNNGGNIFFENFSTAGNASIINNAGGNVDFSFSTGPNNDHKLSAGSIAGLGTYELGANELTVGGNNQSTVVGGVIADGGFNGGSGASLVKIGTGTLTLSGANTYMGGTTVAAGTLAIGNSQALGTGALSLFDGTTLQFAASGLDLGNQVSLAGPDATIDTGANTDTISGAISGSSALTKIGAGTLILSAANTYNGATVVAAGTLVVTGSIANSVVTVGNGGTLGGSGTVMALVAQSGGTVAPGVPAPFTTLNVSGNASFSAGSIFLVNINAAGQNDKLSVTGTTSLSGGTVQVLAANGAYTPSMRFTILTAQGGVTGSFANLTTTSNLAFLTPVLSQDANDVFLGFTAAVTPSGTTVTFPSVAVTPNQISTAAAVQALGSGPLFNAVVGQSVVGARQAFDALSGEVHASAVTAGFEDSSLPREAILDRLSQPLGTPLLGATSSMTGTYAADLPSGKTPGLAPVAVQMYQPRMFDLWGQGFGDWGRTKSDGNAASLTRSTGGFVLGGDVSASNFMGGDWRLGVAGGYTNDRISVSQRASSGTFESVFGGVYAGASFGAVQLRAGALYGTNTSSTTRSINFPGFTDSASANYGGSTAQAFGEAGYRIALSGVSLGGLNFSRASIEPFAGAAAIHIHQNGFTEGGGASALTGLGRDFDVQTTMLGVRGELAFANMPLTLNTMLGWRHAFGNVVPSTLLAFQGGAQSFGVSGVPIDQDAFVAEAGVSYAVTSVLSVGVSYSGQFGQRAMDNAVKGHLNLSF